MFLMFCKYLKSGGDEGIRTLDLCVANAPLSHLSYIPTRKHSNEPHSFFNKNFFYKFFSPRTGVHTFI
jgi:hypothetical protein